VWRGGTTRAAAWWCSVALLTQYRKIKLYGTLSWAWTYQTIQHTVMGMDLPNYTAHCHGHGPTKLYSTLSWAWTYQTNPQNKRTQVFWEMRCHQVSDSWSFKTLNAFNFNYQSSCSSQPLKMKAWSFFKTWGTTHPMTRNFPEGPIIVKALNLTSTQYVWCFRLSYLRNHNL